jgi:hypothetical protein
VAIAARPRPAGGEAEAEARAYAADALARSGYLVREEPFEYSAAVGRYGGPALGAASLLALLAAAAAGVRDHALGAAGVIGISLLVLAAVAGWGAKSGVLGLPVMRRRSVNLVAEPPGREEDGPPRVWLVAHLDSKSQPVAMAVRVFGVAALVAAWVAALALAAAHGWHWMDASRAQRLWPAVAVLAVAGAGPVLFAVVGTRSAGALDNASGVAAVLLAAEELSSGGAVLEDGTVAPRAPVGVLLTSAEELALAGAHAWAAAWEAADRVPGVALNCDGVDDRGALRLFASGPAGGGLAAAAQLAVPDVKLRRPPPGVLVDAVALAQSGWSALTVSRGTWRTLGRVHTRRDTLQHLDGLGVPEAAGALARLARLLGAGRAD